MAVNEVVVNGATELSLVNDTVSEETLLDGTTAHDASGNLIVGKAKYINPNLLINPDFSINQRGLTEYEVLSNSYTADFWKIVYSSSYLTKKITMISDGVEISTTNGAGNGYFADYVQPFERLLDYGKYTLSAIIDGEYRCVTGEIFDDTTPIYSDFGLILYRGYFAIRCFDPTKTIQDVKLELGTVATPFVPPNPAVELVKCQRFFRTISRGAHVEYAGVNGADVVIRVPFEVPMRVTPTCFVLNHKASLHYCNGWVEESTELTILNAITTRYGITLLHVSGFNLSGLNLQIGQNLTLNSDNVFGISAEL